MNKFGHWFSVVLWLGFFGCDFEPAVDLPVCGDGVVEAPQEECDDGNTDDGDGCTAACKNAVCGDGIVNVNAEVYVFIAFLEISTLPRVGQQSDIESAVAQVDATGASGRTIADKAEADSLLVEAPRDFDVAAAQG